MFCKNKFLGYVCLFNIDVGMHIIIVWFYICSFRPSSPVFVSATKYAHIKFIGALKTVHYDIRSRYLAGLKQEMTLQIK